MKKQLLILLASFTMLMSACSSGPSDNQDNIPDLEGVSEPQKEEVAAIEMSFADVFSMQNDDKNVIMEGYLQLPGTMYSSSGSGSVNFSNRPMQRHGESVRISLTMGKCKNCMAKIAEKYSPDDLQVYVEKGSVGPNERVRITGKLSVNESSTSSSGVSASLRNVKIEKIDEVELDYASMGAQAITSENLFDTTLKYTFSKAEGKIEIPSMLFMKDDVTLNIPFGKNKLSVSILFGDGPNLIEEIPSNYSKKDFKIHDFENNVINLTKPVKVYGTRTPPRKDYGGTLYVERIEQ